LIRKVGLIPIDNYIRILDLRNFGRSMIIAYTKKNYNLDITKELQHYENTVGKLWNGDLNIYELFDTNNPFKEIDDGTRKYFNKYGRKRFLKFTDQYEELINEDKAIVTFKPKDVHHIFPLLYGGKSNLLNLTYINNFTHDILHLNPLENISKYCFQAFDYLSYLGSIDLYNLKFSGLKLLNDKYKISNYLQNKTLLHNMYCGAIEEEMNIFYKYISQNVDVMRQVVN
jgi:hypothetical protein